MTSFNIHQAITDKIITAIEQGAGSFRMPWVQTKGVYMDSKIEIGDLPALFWTAFSIRIVDVCRP